MVRDVDELQDASERTIAASRRLRADSQQIRRWSVKLLRDAEEALRYPRPRPSGRPQDANRS